VKNFITDLLGNLKNDFLNGNRLFNSKL
jgi:hypothetical protein